MQHKVRGNWKCNGDDGSLEGKEGSGFIEGAVLVADRGTRLLLEPSDAFPRPRAGSHGFQVLSSKYDMMPTWQHFLEERLGTFEAWDLC